MITTHSHEPDPFSFNTRTAMPVAFLAIPYVSDRTVPVVMHYIHTFFVVLRPLLKMLFIF